MGTVFSTIKNKMYGKILYQAPNPPSYTQLPSEIEFIKGEESDSILASVFINNGVDTTILYSHGNACDMGDIYSSMKSLAIHLKTNIVLYDYPGYGQSSGTPNDVTISSGIEKVWEHYNKKIGGKWIIYGTSLGSGPSCHLASVLSNNTDPMKKSYAGLLLECPLSSVISAVIPEPISYTSSSLDSFPNYSYICNVDKPTFIIHGTEDRVIAHKSSESLANKIDQKYLYKFWSVEGAGHNDIQYVIGYDKFVAKVQKFIAHCVANA